MTSGTAPPTIPSVSTGTPAGEWSESVLASGTKLDTPAKVSTIPGALDINIMDEPDPEPESKEPEKADKQPEKGEGRQGSKEAASLPGTLGTATQTAKQQETAVSSQEEHHDHASMPSEELKGAQPREHTGGVGALPGNISESSVALLPDERRGGGTPSTPPQSAGRERRDTIKPTPATAVAGGSEQTQPREWVKAEEAKIPGEAEPPKEEPAPSIPADISTKDSAEPIEADANKARLLETSESEKGKKTSDTGPAVPTGGGGGETAAGVGSMGNVSNVGETGEKEQGKDPSAVSAKADRGKGPTRDTGDEDNKQVRPTAKPGYGEDYHPAQLHPPPPGASVAEYHTSVDQKEEEHEAPPSPTQTKRASGGTGKKPGFMTMVKGEMKVLAGKMSGDDEKVAEGKKLMHKEE